MSFVSGIIPEKNPILPKVSAYIMSEINQFHRYRVTETTFLCLFSSFGHPVNYLELSGVRIWMNR